MLPVILKQVQDDESVVLESQWGGRSLFINRSPSSPEAKPIVILNLFQDNKLMWPVILKQVQDDETERICTSLT